MRGEILRLVDLSEADREKWRTLADEAIDPNPFFAPDYVEPLARGLRAEQVVQLAVVLDADKWYACVPAHRTDRWHRIRLPVVASWRGHPLYGLLGTPLLAPDSSEGVLEHLLLALRAVRPHPAFLALDWIAGDDLATARLTEHLRADGSGKLLEFERFERAVVRRRPEDTYASEAISTKHRREYRRQRRRLAESLDDEPRLVDRSDDHSAWEELIALEGGSTKSYKGTMLADDPGHTEFFLEMCRRFAARGQLQILALEGAGHTLAMKCNLNTGKAIFGLKIAYAPEWAEFSPGIQLELDSLSYFHDQTEAEIMDSCSDANNAMANRLLPDRRPIISLAIPTDGPIGLLSRPVLHSARAYRTRRSR
jgi:CelD/BcsL family acetyltransferase involved in cellulose biosynthesis